MRGRRTGSLSDSDEGLTFGSYSVCKQIISANTAPQGFVRPGLSRKEVEEEVEVAALAEG